MQEVDLTKDIDKLTYYQAQGLLGQLVLLQQHLEDIYDGVEVALCISCLENKHLLLIKGLAMECVGVCKPGAKWKDLADWAEDFRENKVNQNYLGKRNEKTLELKNQARDFRKQVEGVVIEYKMVNKGNGGYLKA